MICQPFHSQQLLAWFQLPSYLWHVQSWQCHAYHADYSMCLANLKRFAHTEYVPFLLYVSLRILFTKVTRSAKLEHCKIVSHQDACHLQDVIGVGLLAAVCNAGSDSWRPRSLKCPTNGGWIVTRLCFEAFAPDAGHEMSRHAGSCQLCCEAIEAPTVLQWYHKWELDANQTIYTKRMSSAGCDRSGHAGGSQLCCEAICGAQGLAMVPRVAA